MFRMTLAAAAAAALFALAAPAPAQAHMASPGLSTELPSNVERTHYRSYRHYHRSYRHSRRAYRGRHCWNERVRVRVPGGHFVLRTHRRCGWR